MSRRASGGRITAPSADASCRPQALFRPHRRWITRTSGVGAATEQQGRDILQDQINRFNFYQQRPAQQLAQYAGLIGGQYGGEQSGYTRQGLGQTAGRVLGGVLPFFF